MKKKEKEGRKKKEKTKEEGDGEERRKRIRRRRLIEYLLCARYYIDFFPSTHMLTICDIVNYCFLHFRMEDAKAYGG